MIHTGRGFTGRKEKELFKNSVWVPMKEGKKERRRREGRKREKIFLNVKCTRVSEHATYLLETVIKHSSTGVGVNLKCGSLGKACSLDAPREACLHRAAVRPVSIGLLAEHLLQGNHGLQACTSGHHRGEAQDRALRLQRPA